MENHQSPKDRLSATQILPTPSPYASTNTTITTAPNGSNSDAPGSFPVDELDLLLPKVYEALVLAVQYRTSLALQAEDDGKGKEAEIIKLSVSPDNKSNPKAYVINVHSHPAGDVGFIKPLPAKFISAICFSNLPILGLQLR